MNISNKNSISNSENNNSNDKSNHSKEEKNVYSTPKKYLNSSNQIEEENDDKSSTSKIHFRSLSNTKNVNKEKVKILNIHKFNFSIYALKKAKFCCF